MSDTDGRHEEEGSDLESRRLCPDDTCIGVIGPDGKCKVCGAESPDGSPPQGGAAETAAPAPEKKAQAAPTPEKKAQAAPAPEQEHEVEEEHEAEEEPTARAPETEGKPESAGFDPDDRVLCPDDMCTGLIGPDGKCKVCGAESPDGPPPARGTAKAPAPAPKAPPRPVAKSKGKGKGESDGFDPDDRILCSDDTCTGLVGPDGKCKVCGKPHEG